MSLWGALDNATGNQKPVFANSNNKNMLSTTVYGVSVTERANTSVANVGSALGLAHSGWNIIKRGTGGIKTITISSAGTGVNANGFLTVTQVTGANTQNINIAYFMGNTLNSLQSFSVNPASNGVMSVAIANTGIGYNAAPTVAFAGSNTTLPTFAFTMGGRVGRITSETLVATGSIAGDDSADDGLLPGT